MIRRRALIGWLAAGLAPRTQATPAERFDSNFAGAQWLDHEGRRFGTAQLAGKIVLFNFVFTGCSSVCPVQTHALAQLQRELPAGVRGDVHFVSFSLDPLSDTPATLKAYARRMGADLRGWSFVTGRPQDVDHVAERLRLFPTDRQAARPADHAGALWLTDRSGRLMQRYSGTPPDTARLGREIVQLHAARR